MDTRGIVLNISNGGILIFDKTTPGFLRTLKKTRNNAYLNIGDIVDVEIGGDRICRSPMTLYTLVSKKEGNLKFLIKYIYINELDLDYNGDFDDIVFGVVDNSEMLVNVGTQYTTIEVSQHPEKNGKYFWKVTNCQKADGNWNYQESMVVENADEAETQNELLMEKTRKQVNKFGVGKAVLLKSVQDEMPTDNSMSKRQSASVLKPMDEDALHSLVNEANEAPLPSDSSDDEEFTKKNKILKEQKLRKQEEQESGSGTKLNPDQKTAVRVSLETNKKFVLIQGPPGTGKTDTLAKIVCDLVEKNQQVLVVTPTKLSLENIKKRVLNLKNERSLACHGNVFVDNENNEEVSKETMVMLALIQSRFIKTASKWRRFKPKISIFDEADKCLTEKCGIELKSLWEEANGIERVILAGDPQQFICFSEGRGNGSMEVSLMEQISRNEDPDVVNLRTQYRMNTKIIGWSSQVFYNSEIESDQSVAKIEMSSIPKINPVWAEKIPRDVRFRALAICDTGAEKDGSLHTTYFEDKDIEGSYFNIGEAKIIAQQVFLLRHITVPLRAIAVLTPYKGQKIAIEDEIRKRFKGELPVDVETVDAFKGQTRDVILFSFVRNNPLVQLGFVGNSRRMNVAITRAKRQFFMVCSLYMLQNAENRRLVSLFEYIQEKAQILSPPMIRGVKDETPDEVKHHFGDDYRCFIEKCKNSEMIRECEEEIRKKKAYQKVDYFRLQK